jgi:hypothetical protein
MNSIKHSLCKAEILVHEGVAKGAKHGRIETYKNKKKQERKEDEVNSAFYNCQRNKSGNFCRYSQFITYIYNYVHVLVGWV